MKAMAWTRATGWAGLALLAALLAGCGGGGLVRRVSEPSARLQQLTVGADGQWTAQLRIENFSSIPMRFESVDLALDIGDYPAGRLSLSPGITIGPESADVVEATLTPAGEARLAIADALAGGRSAAYTLEGTIGAIPDEGRLRRFEIERSSMLSPAPGLPGVLR